MFYPCFPPTLRLSAHVFAWHLPTPCCLFPILGPLKAPRESPRDLAAFLRRLTCVGGHLPQWEARVQGRRPTVQVPRDSRRGAAAPAHAWRRCRAQFDDLAPTADHLSPGARRLSSSSRPARTCASAPGHGKVPHSVDPAPRTHRQGRRARARPQTRARCASGCGGGPLGGVRRQSAILAESRSWPTIMWPLTGFRPPDIVGSRRGSNPWVANHL